MGKQASNADVSSIEVEVDGPEDAAGKQNRLRSGDGTLSITGSGGSATLDTNGSSGNWFLQRVTVHARSGSAAARSRRLNIG